MGRLLFFLLLVACGAEASFSALYLSWYDDPTTTMTIQWHATTTDPLFLQTSEGKWVSHAELSQPFPEEDILIHTVALTGLSPNTTYSFRIGKDGDPYTFRTAPATLAEPLKFIIGGDLYLSPKLFRKMCDAAVSLDPLFAVLGGDLAYALNHGPITSASKQWRRFLNEWTERMVTPDRRIIPFLVVPGNHDISPNDFELFFALFAFPSHELYRAVDFGNYLSLILLDTGHFHPIQGKQTNWLRKTLSARSKTPFVFSVYHEGAYPSHYKYDGRTPIKIRENWCPLFDDYHVQAAFEHHSHTLKQTYPIKEGQINPAGTIYFGDGCWGASPRTTHDLWYLDVRARKNNIYFIEMSSATASIQSIGLLGEVLYKTTIQSH